MLQKNIVPVKVPVLSGTQHTHRAEVLNSVQAFDGHLPRHRNRARRWN